MGALIRFFLHKDCETIDEYAIYWNEIIYLSKIGAIPMAQIPLKLE